MWTRKPLRNGTLYDIKQSKLPARNALVAMLATSSSKTGSIFVYPNTLSELETVISNRTCQETFLCDFPVAAEEWRVVVCGGCDAKSVNRQQSSLPTSKGRILLVSSYCDALCGKHSVLTWGSKEQDTPIRYSTR
mmetsp:Transcript_13060/g.30383  ORF Transcript_13060/g.30383 Transcript_13060/m.30383 type:complete len:135 (-) Transcript_13060:368-772(-)